MIATFELSKRSVIYVVIHRASGMCYVGSSVNGLKRYKEHMRAARIGSRCYFHRVLAEFGPDSFDFDILEECPKEILLKRERFWIVFFVAATVDGFNSRENPVATYDNNFSDVTRARMREAKQGSKLSIEHRNKISAAVKACWQNPKTRVKITGDRKGRKLSSEATANIRASKVGYRPTLKSQIAGGKSHKGKKRSPESCERMRQAAQLRAAKKRSALALGKDGP